MFYNCNFKKINLFSYKTDNLKNINFMFGNCQYLTELDLSSFNIENVMYMNNLLYNCKSLELLIGISDWKTKNVVDMNNTYLGCKSLKSFPDFSKRDTNKDNKAPIKMLIQFDKKIYKEFHKILNDIFSYKNLKNKYISIKIVEIFKKQARKLLINKECPLDYFSQYICELIERTPKEFHNNLHEKRIEIFQILNKINDDILREKILNKEREERQNIDIKNFDIEAFRKEFNLSKEDFPDKLIKKFFIKYKGNTEKMFEGLFC